MFGLGNTYPIQFANRDPPIVPAQRRHILEQPRLATALRATQGETTLGLYKVKHVFALFRAAELADIFLRDWILFDHDKLGLA
jgi:hypothetical protein